MPKSSTEPSVCVCFFHPLVLERCKHLLKGMRVLAERFSPSSVTNPSEIEVARAETYVVEGDPAKPLSQMIVTAIFRQHPEARILVIGESLEDNICFPLLRLGAKGLIKFEDADNQLVRAVEMVHSGGFWVPRQLLSLFVESILQKQHPPACAVGYLTARERQVLDYLLRNLSNKEIAANLAVSERTVKFHVSQLLSKFGVQRRGDLILLCFQNQSGSKAAPQATASPA
jgi:DNA-binding NarL/FixJ family response regulator